MTNAWLKEGDTLPTLSKDSLSKLVIFNFKLLPNGKLFQFHPTQDNSFDIQIDVGFIWLPACPFVYWKGPPLSHAKTTGASDRALALRYYRLDPTPLCGSSALKRGNNSVGIIWNTHIPTQVLRM